MTTFAVCLISFPSPSHSLMTALIRTVEEPKMPHKEKVRMIKKQQEDKKQARADAEKDSIDLYEQVRWMNEYEVS